MAWLPLEALLHKSHPGRLVAREPELDHAAFRERVLAVAGSLAAQRTRRAALWFSDAGELAVALFACWRAGVTALLPGDNYPHTCAALDSTVDLWLSDSELPLPADRQYCLQRLTAGPALAPAQLDLDAAGVVVCTSGSSGQPKQIAKRWRQLRGELDALQACWPGLDAAAAVIGSVAAQHMYGLPFRVLWPLCAGRPIDRLQRVYPEEIEAASLKCRHALWIASPALLKRLTGRLDWPALAPTVCAIFSSGGPLPESAAEALVERGLPRPIEIYGSSETGAVAWRSGTDPWHVLPGVEIGVLPGGEIGVQSELPCTVGAAAAVAGKFESELESESESTAAADGTLWVRSPWTEAGACEQTRDRVRLDGNGFHLLDRDDRIVKIEENRVALPQVERWLAGHAYVDENRVGQLRTGERLTALVALTPDGLRTLRHAGRRAVVDALQAHMAGKVPSCAAPRRWRLMSSLPYNAQGKLTADAFKRAAGARPTQPVVAAVITRAVSDPTTGRPSGPALALASSSPFSPISGLAFNRISTPPADPASGHTRLPASAGASPIRGLPADGRECRLRITVPVDLAHFSGHFPTAPIVPGIVQVAWAVSLAREYLGVELDVAGIDNLKFQRLLRPGDALDAHLKWEPARSRLCFTFTAAANAVASGRILQRGEAAE